MAKSTPATVVGITGIVEARREPTSGSGGMVIKGRMVVVVVVEAGGDVVGGTPAVVLVAGGGAEEVNVDLVEERGRVVVVVVGVGVNCMGGSGRPSAAPNSSRRSCMFCSDLWSMVSNRLLRTCWVRAWAAGPVASSTLLRISLFCMASQIKTIMLMREKMAADNPSRTAVRRLCRSMTTCCASSPTLSASVSTVPDSASASSESLWTESFMSQLSAGSVVRQRFLYG